MFKDIVTNPSEHQTDRYIYLVYAFHQSNPAKNTLEGIKATVDRIQDSNKFFRASLVGRLDPKLARERFGLYERINQTGTFGDIGLVVHLASDEQVRIAWNCDLASGLTEDKLAEFVSQHDGKVRDPHYLLTQTAGTGDLNYNEIVLNGHPATQVGGVFYKGDNLSLRANILATILGHFYGSTVPVVVLVDEESTKIDAIEMTGRKLGEIIASIPQIVQAREEFFRS